MNEPVLLDKEGILIHLENYRLIAKIGAITSGFYDDSFVQADMALRIEAVEKHLEELEECDKEKHDHALCQANRILAEIRTLVNRAIEKGEGLS
jgi:hypothetical protein